jgi:putative radical SAM enzyme (TIGR03279 family)
MPIIINKKKKKSIAYSLPIKKGFNVIRIDNHLINDVLDLIYFTQNDSFTIEVTDLNNKTHVYKVKNTFDKPLGIEVDLPECKNCVNNCIFCFIDQMPPNMRDALYVKDDDLIYSFFYGNFITLTNLTDIDFNKIISQRISPLYVSVHTTNPILHKTIMRYEHEFIILDVLKRFMNANIEIHAQIVLMPGVNDGNELDNTLVDLIELENIISVGIVPVGLTKFRDNNLRKYNKIESVDLINKIDIYKKEKFIDHIYLADEFYLIAEKPIPNDEYYDDYIQIENGIGMIRQSYLNWKLISRKFLRLLNNKEGTPVFITSISGIKAIKPIINQIEENIKDKEIKTFVIKNNYFGEEVTVTGLLTWNDISTQISLQVKEYLILSSAIFNADMKTLDDVHISDIKNDLNCDIVVLNELFLEWHVY